MPDPRFRLLSAGAAGLAVLVLSACGSGSSGGGPQPSTSPSTPSPSASSSGTAVTVGTNVLQKSTLDKGGTPYFHTGGNVVETSKGLQLTTRANRSTVAVSATPYVDGSTTSQKLPQSLEIGVTVTPPTTPGLLYGIGCEGDFDLFGDQYAAVTDSQGHWQIVSQHRYKNPTVLAKGTATMSGGDTQLNLACVEQKGKNFLVRLSFAIDGTIVDTIDHSDNNIGATDGYQLVVADPGTGHGGAAVFHNLEVRSASLGAS